MESSIGDMALLSQMWEEHKPKLLAMLERRIDPSLAVRIAPEDILHEAYLRASGKYTKFKEQQKPSPYGWLYRIALDCLIEAWRRESRDCRDLARDLPFPAESSAQLGLGLVGSATSPSNAVARKQLQEKMKQLLDLVKPKDREVLWMRHFDQLSHGDIADILGISEQAANLRYVRALKRLKDLWETLFGEFETT